MPVLVLAFSDPTVPASPNPTVPTLSPSNAGGTTSRDLVLCTYIYLYISYTHLYLSTYTSTYTGSAMFSSASPAKLPRTSAAAFSSPVSSASAVPVLSVVAELTQAICLVVTALDLSTISTAAAVLVMPAAVHSLCSSRVSFYTVPSLSTAFTTKFLSMLLALASFPFLSATPTIPARPKEAHSCIKFNYAGGCCATSCAHSRIQRTHLQVQNGDSVQRLQFYWLLSGSSLTSKLT